MMLGALRIKAPNNLKEKLKLQLGNFQKHPKKRHFVVGFGTAAVLATLAVLFISGKSSKVKASASHPVVIQSPISSPDSTQPFPRLAIEATASLPPTEIAVKPMVSLLSSDGIPVGEADGSAFGVFKRPTVRMTPDLANFSNDLSKFFIANRLQAVITSAVRSSSSQLDLIKEAIAERGMTSSFPGLESASLQDSASWIAAWEWLKARRVPINPPGDYVDDEGKKVGASLHLKGLALDLVADDLNSLATAIAFYANSSANRGAGTALKIVGVVRESDCIHVSLSK